MAIRLLNPANGQSILDRAPAFLGITFLAFFLVMGTVSCGTTEESVGEETFAVKEGIIEFEGTVKVAVGRYVFIPEARGFDIILQGDIEGGIEGLVGKEVKGEGEYSPEIPSILIANSLIEKDAGGEGMNIFTRRGDVMVAEWMTQQGRDEVFAALVDLEYDKKEGWEGKEKAKVFGKLEQNEDVLNIVVLDDKDREIGRIIVDSMDDLADFYIKKLNLFDKFWFYMDVKETVEWNTRRRSRELFHADVLFAGLY
ncbi:MAG: hypothetical protein WBE11_05530 [Candidatus Aminicenantaceae bacterium]